MSMLSSSSLRLSLFHSTSTTTTTTTTTLFLLCLLILFSSAISQQQQQPLQNSLHAYNININIKHNVHNNDNKNDQRSLFFNQTTTTNNKKAFQMVGQKGLRTVGDFGPMVHDPFEKSQVILGVSNSDFATIVRFDATTTYPGYHSSNNPKIISLTYAMDNEKEKEVLDMIVLGQHWITGRYEHLSNAQSHLYKYYLLVMYGDSSRDVKSSVIVKYSITKREIVRMGAVECPFAFSIRTAPLTEHVDVDMGLLDDAVASASNNLLRIVWKTPHEIKVRDLNIETMLFTSFPNNIYSATSLYFVMIPGDNMIALNTMTSSEQFQYALYKKDLNSLAVQQTVTLMLPKSIDYSVIVRYHHSHDYESIVMIYGKVHASVDFYGTKDVGAPFYLIHYDIPSNKIVKFIDLNEFSNSTQDMFLYSSLSATGSTVLLASREVISSSFATSKRFTYSIEYRMILQLGEPKATSNVLLFTTSLLPFYSISYRDYEALESNMLITNMAAFSARYTIEDLANKNEWAFYNLKDGVNCLFTIEHDVPQPDSHIIIIGTGLNLNSAPSRLEQYNFKYSKTLAQSSYVHMKGLSFSVDPNQVLTCFRGDGDYGYVIQSYGDNTAAGAHISKVNLRSLTISYNQFVPWRYPRTSFIGFDANQQYLHYISTNTLNYMRINLEEGVVEEQSVINIDYRSVGGYVSFSKVFWHDEEKNTVFLFSSGGSQKSLVRINLNSLTLTGYREVFKNETGSCLFKKGSYMYMGTSSQVRRMCRIDVIDPTYPDLPIVRSFTFKTNETVCSIIRCTLSTDEESVYIVTDEVVLQMDLATQTIVIQHALPKKQARSSLRVMTSSPDSRYMHLITTDNNDVSRFNSFHIPVETSPPKFRTRANVRLILATVIPSSIFLICFISVVLVLVFLLCFYKRSTSKANVASMRERLLDSDFASLAHSKTSFTYFLKDISLHHFISGTESLFKGQLIARGENIFVKRIISRRAVSSEEKRLAASECEKMMSYQHPRIAQVYGVCIDRDCVLLLTEYGDCKTASQLITSQEIPFNQKLRILTEICSAMCYIIYEQHSLCRELHLQNIMVDNEFHIKLIDPGLCRQLSPEPTLSNIHYMAPEVLDCKTQSEQTEIYAFSMLMFELLFQTKALHVEEHASLFTIGLEVVAGKRPQFPWIDDQGMEEWCNRRKMNQEQATQYINLMTKCWSADASQRPSFKEIQSILNDLYYTS